MLGSALHVQLWRLEAMSRQLDRLQNVSQLTGFSKRDDLAYFLRAICGIEYFHRPDLAPSKELFDAPRT